MTWGRQDVTRDYLIGEVSVRLERLQSVTGREAGHDVALLRQHVETEPLTLLAASVARALALADELCWDSLFSGAMVAFDKQARISADLRQFGLCACLLREG
jgi:hypothetical protein